MEDLFNIVRVFDTQQRRENRWKTWELLYSGEELFNRNKKGERGRGV